MEKWQRSLSLAINDISLLAKRFELDPEKLREAVRIFPFRVTLYYLSLIQEKNDPIYRQCIPDEAELNGSNDLMDDPLGEEINAHGPCLVKRYPDRALLLVSNQCASYCRFCTRKRKFRKTMCVSKPLVKQGIEFIRKSPEIRDVLVSGGDPFLLTDDRLEEILRELRVIPHVEIIRIGTRTPCVLPERITLKLTRMLKKYHPLFVNVHFNHPRELTPEAVKALGRLADAGIPLGSQTVLLKGVNDDPAVMKSLMQKLLMARVKPYYIFQTDLIYGNDHFRTPLSKGLEIMDQLRCWTSGLAVPYFVIDLPHGVGKVPLLPEYLLKREGKNILFRNYKGELYNYPDITDH